MKRWEVIDQLRALKSAKGSSQDEVENLKELKQDQNENKARLHRHMHARTCKSERKFVKYVTLPHVSRWLLPGGREQNHGGARVARA